MCQPQTAETGKAKSFELCQPRVVETGKAQHPGDTRKIQETRSIPRWWWMQQTCPGPPASDSADTHLRHITEAQPSGQRRATTRRKDVPINDLYEIKQEKIGQGSFAIVCAARQRETGCLRAVKVIQKARVKDPKQVKRG